MDPAIRQLLGELAAEIPAAEHRGGLRLDSGRSRTIAAVAAVTIAGTFLSAGLWRRREAAPR